MVRWFSPFFLAALALMVANPLSAAPPAPSPREVTQQPTATGLTLTWFPFSLCLPFQTYHPGSRPLLPSDIGPYPQYFPAPGVHMAGSPPVAVATASVPATKVPARPVGIWVRDTGLVKVVLKLTDDRLTTTAIFATDSNEWPVVRVTLDADYAVAKDGTLFGVISGADATQPMYATIIQLLDGQPFAFGWRVDGDTLTVRNLKWLGAGLPLEKASAFDELPLLGNGRYTRMDEAKLPEWEKKLTGTATPLMRTVSGGLTAPATNPAPSAPPLFRHVEGKCEAPTPESPVPVPASFGKSAQPVPVPETPPPPPAPPATLLVPQAQPVPPATIAPGSGAPVERPGVKVEARGAVPVLPPLREGAKPEAPTPPCIHDVLNALPPVPQGVPLILEVSRENIEQTVWLVKELEADKLDPPRFYPLVGPARLHQATWKCTVAFTETITSEFPIRFKVSCNRVEVVRVPQTSLYMYVGPEAPATPAGEPTKVSSGAGSVVPVGGTAPANPLHGTWLREQDGMQVVLKLSEKRLNVEIIAAFAMLPGENGPPIRFTQSLDADYSTTPDGTVFGILTGMDVSLGEGLPPEAYASLKDARRQYERMTGAMFKFRTRLDGDKLTLSDAKASLFDTVRGPNGEAKGDTSGAVSELLGGRFVRVTGKVPPPKPIAGGFINQYSADPNVQIEQLPIPDGERRQVGEERRKFWNNDMPNSIPMPKCKDCVPPLKPIPGAGVPVPPIAEVSRLGSAVQVAQAQPPTGTWKINANGHEGELVIESVADGKVDGTLLGDKIRGYYDQKSKCLSLLRLGGDGNTKQTFKGYLFLNPEEEKQTKYNLAGTFQVFYGEGGAGVEYGWYAHVTMPKE